MRTGAPSVRRTLARATERLERAGIPEPAASAEVLLAELLGVGRAEVASHDGCLTGPQEERYGAWISRRLEREPVQRILGYAYFRNLRLDLDAATLIPRPDTESVVETALEQIDLRGGRCRVLDTGTGSGAIAIAVAQERPSCEVYATDISEAALEVARRNAARAGTKVGFHHADVASGLGFLKGSVDLLVSNPPYVKTAEMPTLAPEVRAWDPHRALDGGPDGLSLYRRIFAEAPPLLRDGADVVLEVAVGSAPAVLGLASRAGYEPLGCRRDLAGSPRAVLARWRR